MMMAPHCASSLLPCLLVILLHASRRCPAATTPPASPRAVAAPSPLCENIPGRPVFHPTGELQPGGSSFTTHTNDVNSIFWYKGLYHAMFQERKPYPCADWAHLVSAEAATWRRLPDALAPTKHSFDGGGVLDGQLSLLPGLDPVILYDAHGPERGRDCPVKSAAGDRPGKNSPPLGASTGDGPTIGIAHPSDPSDPELKSQHHKHSAVCL